ncbi:MAG: hypothetical protein SOY42_11060 [Clostridium sp.]|nr:hypothetical protein [Clostridium sp.]
MIYKIMFYGGIFLSITTFLIFILVSIKMNIIDVIQDLTGVKAKKEIEELKHKNESINLQTDNLILKERGLEFSNKEWNSYAHSLEKKDSNSYKNEKDIEIEETGVLSEDGTTILSAESEGTSVLNNESLETSILLNDNVSENNENIEDKNDEEGFYILLNVVSINTDEVI